MNLPISPMGMNTPLMNIRGNLIRVDNIIMFEGVSVGGADINEPRVEKQNADRTVPMIKYRLTIPSPSRTTPMMRIKDVMKRPNKKEAIMSPRRILHSATGVETSLSKVFILVSQGVIIGPMAEVVKNSAMPTNPGIRISMERFLPSIKAMNRKEGSNNPNIRVGPFRKYIVRSFLDIANALLSCSKKFIYPSLRSVSEIPLPALVQGC